MTTAEILTYKNQNGILTSVLVHLATESAAVKVANCPYCLGALALYRQVKARCFNPLCPSNGATPEQMHERIGPDWMPPFYTFSPDPELMIYACYINGVFAIPVKDKQCPWYNMAILAKDISDFVAIGIFIGSNQKGFLLPARKSEDEIIQELKNRPNYFYHE